MDRTNGHTNPGKDPTTSQYNMHFHAKNGLWRRGGRIGGQVLAVWFVGSMQQVVKFCHFSLAPETHLDPIKNSNPHGLVGTTYAH